MESNKSSLHIVMFPWFGLGHITPYLHISNKLARKGHKISFIVPIKTQSKIQHLNQFPQLITFVPIAVPHVDGLPPGAETTSDVPSASLIPLIVAAMDLTEHDIELLLSNLRPHIVFFDFAYWIPKLARQLGIKSVFLNAVSLVLVGYISGRDKEQQETSNQSLEKLLMQPPPGFPDPSVKLHRFEVQHFVSFISRPFGTRGDLKLIDRFKTSQAECDAFASKGCREIEGPFIEFVERYHNHGRPVLLAGPIIPEPPITTLTTSEDEKWTNFLGRFEATSVIYCSFGSEGILKIDQFQELLLGFELSGLPFLAALKPPLGVETIEEALPDGFEERVGGRGVVHGGWIQQQLILQHPSVGCYVTHCGYGSLIEGLVMSKKCQLVMIPHKSDQCFNARVIGNRLKAGVEVERNEEDGMFSRESVCDAIRTVMEENFSEAGREVRANCTKLRELLLSKDLESSYVDDLSHKLRALLD
ncbi:hypothetical protein TIFTF001_009819 [Ficus carica]|uniref:Glycosyltransferase n=1 Tax=Ficus carica TaxID=3494 RepID=A0AA87ZX31_FICCA|nr:hypothetical protein TIFTF001_009819 [Ficus carica]